MVYLFCYKYVVHNNVDYDIYLSVYIVYIVFSFSYIVKEPVVASRSILPANIMIRKDMEKAYLNDDSGRSEGLENTSQSFTQKLKQWRVRFFHFFRSILVEI